MAKMPASFESFFANNLTCVVLKSALNRLKHSSSKLRANDNPEPMDASLGAGVADNTAFSASGATPCVAYQCSLDLILSMVSPNSFDLIGVRPENIIGNRALWDERVTADDRPRLQARLAQLEPSALASEIHKITDDCGLPVWVAHTFRRTKVDQSVAVHGCMIPLSTDFRARFLDSSIISQFVHKIGNHFQLINLLIGSLTRTGTNPNEIESLQQTIDRAVDFTRSFSHFSQPLTATTPTSLAELLPSVAKSAASAAYEKNVAVKIEMEPSLNNTVISGDPFLLEFAFAAVLRNALDATQSGGQVVLSCKRESPVPGKRTVARIAITDTGHGIENNALAKVSEPFFSLQRDRDGLGLSSAVRIVELHGGALDIASVPARGTEVQIRLPIDDQKNISVTHVQCSNR